MDTLGARAEEEARKRDLFDDFIYLNYADGQQSVYERSVTPIDLERMQNIRLTYDPLGHFQKFWKGGFKLPETQHGVPVERDEL